ncbi:MAG TPA: hypothetical protein VIY86_14125, partial [Pirellulaceae bacterium]
METHLLLLGAAKGRIAAVLGWVGLIAVAGRYWSLDRWELGDRDCAVIRQDFERLDADVEPSDGSPGCDHWDITCGVGTFLYARRSVPPVSVIQEL